MTDIETAILETLNDLGEKVRSMKTANPKPNLLPIFAKLDDLAAKLPKATTDPELIHFLQRKSYEKARMLLIEAGSGAS